VGTGCIWPNGYNRHRLTTERAAKAITGRQLNLHPRRRRRSHIQILQHEIEQDILRAEPIELNILDPDELQRHSGMENKVEPPVDQLSIHRKQVHIKLETNPAIGALARIKTHTENLSIMKRGPRSKSGLERIGIQDLNHH
jgi:hypothetical protein